MLIKTLNIFCLVFVLGLTTMAQSEPQFYTIFQPLLYMSDYHDTIIESDSTIHIRYYSNSTNRNVTPFADFLYSNEGRLIGYEYFYHPSNHADSSVLKSVMWSYSGKLIAYEFRQDDTELTIKNTSLGNEFTVLNDSEFDSRTLTLDQNDIKIIEVQRKGDTLNKIYYYPNGNIREFIQMIRINNRNYLNGVYRYNHPNGQPFIVGHHLCDSSLVGEQLKNLRDAVWSYYNEKGMLMKRERFVHGLGAANILELSSKLYAKFITRKDYETYSLLVRFENVYGRFHP